MFVIRLTCVPGNMATLGKCHGSKERKYKCIDKYIGKTNNKTEKDKNVGEKRITIKFSNRLLRHPVSGVVTY